MEEKPEALRLADMFEAGNCGYPSRAAAELRRLHEENQKLREYAAAAVNGERNKLVAWMIQFGFATGHGDTMEQLVDALGSEIVDRIEVEIDCEREACAKVCEELHPGLATRRAAEIIRARGETK